MPDAFVKEFQVPASGAMPPQWHEWLRAFLPAYLRAYAGKRFKLSISPLKRSLGQNAKMHAMFAEIASAFVAGGLTEMQLVAPTGEVVPLPVTMESVKLYMKAVYGPRDEQGQIRSTASYNVTEAHDFITAVQNDPAVLRAGIYLGEYAA